MARMRRSPLELLSVALSTLRTQGPLVFAEKAATAAGWRRMFLLTADPAEAPLARPAKVPVDIRFLHPSELGLVLASQPALERPWAETRLFEGKQCLVALHDGKVAGSCWVARDAIFSDWAWVRQPLAHDEAYVFAAHTAAAYRGQGVNFALNAHLSAWLRDQGVRHSYRLTLPWNVPALAAHRKAGFRVCGQFVALGHGRFGRSLFLAASD
jgi:GNAT superfamily N-acetyltransferase